MHEFLERVFFALVEYGILIFEIVGAAIILVAGVKAFIALVTKPTTAS